MYGIRGKALELIRSYLLDRPQRVRIGNSFSDERSVNLGVGQGSMLGPILFLFYVNDLPNVTSLLNTILYADDTTIYLSSKNPNDTVPNVNDELTRVSGWFDANRISVNLEKTFVTLFSTRNTTNLENIFINGEIVKFAVQVRFLGVHLDPKLNFVNHINHICSKLSRTVGIMYKLRRNVPEPVRINLYYSLFYPYLIYCNLVWGGACPTNLQPVVLLQKKIIRVICGQSYLAHTNNLFLRTKILKLNYLRKFLLCLYYFKNSTNFPTTTHDYATRNRDNANPTFQRLMVTQRSLLFSAPTAWNTLPSNLKSISRYNLFKRKLKDYLIDQYSSNNLIQ